MMVFRRWRHLLVFMGSLFFLEIVGTWIYEALSRPRPYGVPIIASWAGYSGASPPVAVLTIFLMGIVYCLAVPGRPRTYAKVAVAAVVAVFCLARLYLGVDHPGDVLLGVAFAVAIAVTAFRFFTPNEVFPVAYRRGKTAHVDVTGRRGEAIRAGGAGPARADRDRDQAGRARVRPQARPRCGCGSRAARMSTCSPSSTRRATSAPTAGTSWGGPSSTARWRTRLPSRRCGAWSSTRTTPCACCRTSGSARPGPTASSRSPPSASTCWSPSSSRTPSRSARPRSTTG